MKSSVNRATWFVLCRQDYHQDYLDKNPGDAAVQIMRLKKLERLFAAEARRGRSGDKRMIYPSDETEEELFCIGHRYITSLERRDRKAFSGEDTMKLLKGIYVDNRERVNAVRIDG